MKVLILSLETWKDGTNGGNVLSNIFSDTGLEFAQIYCSAGHPENSLCTRYYQITDSMVIHSFITHKKVGRKFTIKTTDKGIKERTEQNDKKFYSFFKSHRWGIFLAAKNIIWNLSNWKHPGLQDFVQDFAPDIIFAPCYGNIFMQKLTRYVADLTGKNVISYISDDHYTLHHFSLSPYFWIHKFYMRRQLRKTFAYYSLVYTMTETQKQQCEKDFHANMKILMKAVPLEKLPVKTSIEYPLRIVYAGGIYLNRWKTLRDVADAIRRINHTGTKFRMDIYTENTCSTVMKKSLHDGINTFLHSSVSQNELREIYHNSDIALHVESFDLKNRLSVRMSFSTKIVDCLASGCAVMAICDEKQGGMVYLKENDSAICVTDRREIYHTLDKLACNPQKIIDYANKAKACCIRNHDKEKNREIILKDFKRYCK